ncbi:MAG: DNA-3-methyladenine glycosylase [Candidatus Omnitrophica bacterium]|nr:DNA-3-methyladenine glycosylase [Candidatus Omnitrophota bacterium]
MKFSLPVSDFNLEHTLECGQAFRWERSGDFYTGVIGESLVKAAFDGRELTVETGSRADKEKIADYFGLNEDLPRIYKEIGTDPHVKKAIKKYHGLRILNQDRWECLASFILSSYTNIPRIKKMIAGLSKKFGKRLVLGRMDAYSFPPAGRIAGADIKILKGLGLGFRAAYIKDTARKVASKKFDLDALEDLNYKEAKERLMSLKGVGEKVADCVLLFSFKRYEAFPVDVWIKRGIEELYFSGKAAAPKKAAEFARERFGAYAGYAQEYLYHYLRHGREKA